MKDPQPHIEEIAFKALDSFRIEVPSWGFANTGTRFGKFVQAAAASTIEEKFADAAEVNRLTGVTPTLALHVLVGSAQRPEGRAGSEAAGEALRRSLGIDQSQPLSGSGVQVRFALQSLGRHSRAGAGTHAGLDRDRARRSVRATSRSGWPMDPIIPARRACASASAGLEEALRIAHSHLAHDQRLLVEYKPFEPAFYHTDIADWGMSSHLARQAGPQAQRAGGYGPPLQRAEHRADCGVAAAHRTCWADSTSTTGAMPTTI